MKRLTLKFTTEKSFINITDHIEKEIPDEFNGLVNIFSTHTTCGIKILENELLLLADYHNFLEKLAPKDGIYQHNIIGIRNVPVDERVNGHSHIQSLFFPTSETIPIENGKLMIGKWQSIFLVELDPVRDRKIVITFMGE